MKKFFKKFKDDEKKINNKRDSVELYRTISKDRIAYEMKLAEEEQRDEMLARVDVVFLNITKNFQKKS